MSAHAAPSFFERLAERARTIDSLLCVGLDPRGTSADELRAECTRLIEATSDYAIAYKPNSAFFEAVGPEGMLALRGVIENLPSRIAAAETPARSSALPATAAPENDFG